MSELLTEEILHKKKPEELTILLYDACITNLQQAKIAINRKNFVKANQLIIKANDILYRLGAGINYEAGTIADQLEMLYEYMAQKLVEANLKKDTTLIDEVLNVLKMIAEAWRTAMENSNSQPVNKKIMQRSSAYDMGYNASFGSVDIKE